MTPLHMALAAGAALVLLKQKPSISKIAQDALKQAPKKAATPKQAGRINFAKMWEAEIKRQKTPKKNQRDVMLQLWTQKFPENSRDEMAQVFLFYPDMNRMLAKQIEINLRHKGWSEAKITEFMTAYQGMRRLQGWWNNVPVEAGPMTDAVKQDIIREMRQSGVPDDQIVLYLEAYQKARDYKARMQGKQKPTHVSEREEAAIRVALQKEYPGLSPQDVDDFIKGYKRAKKLRAEDSWWPNWLTVGIIGGVFCFFFGPEILAYYGLVEGATALELLMGSITATWDVYTIMDAAGRGTGVGVWSLSNNMLSVGLSGPQRGFFRAVKDGLREVGIQVAGEAAMDLGDE